MEPATPKLSRSASLVCVVLLTLFSCAVVDNARHWGCTSDERFDLPAGYSYLVTGDFRMNPEHPPLVKELTALALLPLHPDFPVNKTAWADADVVNFGDDFLFHNRISSDRLLFYGRIPCVLMAILLGWLVFHWGRELHGERGAIVSLFLFCTCPNLIAHSALATTDVAITLFYVATFFALWRFRIKQSRASLYSAAFLAAFASLSKYSGLLVYPLVAALMAHVCFRTQGKRLLLFVYSGCVFVVAWLLSALLLFRSGALLTQYVNGLQSVYIFHDAAQISYCLGEVYFGSRWYYFLVALVVKSPVPFLMAAMAGLLILLKRRKESLDQLLFLLLPAVVFLAVISFGVPDNIGLRHVLPVLPFLQIISGGIAPAIMRSAYRKSLSISVLMLALWLAIGVAAIHPNEISYFNELAGGPKNGYRFLADSNIDWGQNVVDLKTYGGQQPLLIKRFVIDPAFYGIKYLSLGDSDLANPGSGTYILSAHYLAIGRCTWWLRQRTPQAWIGNSLLVYRFDTGTSKLAEQAYRDGAKTDASNDPWFLEDAGAFYLAKKQYGEAIPFFRKTLQLRPDHPTARADLGFALLGNNDGSGYAEIEVDLAKHPQKMETMFALAYRYLETGNAVRGEFWLRQISQNSGRSLFSVLCHQIADIRLGTLDQKRGHYRLALARYGEALSWPYDLRRNQAAALLGRGSALGMLNRTTPAIASFEAALSLEPDNATTHYVYGMLLSKNPASGSKAIQQLNEALRYEKDPGQRQVIEKALDQLRQPASGTKATQTAPPTQSTDPPTEH